MSIWHPPPQRRKTRRLGRCGLPSHRCCSRFCCTRHGQRCHSGQRPGSAGHPGRSARPRRCGLMPPWLQASVGVKVWSPAISFKEVRAHWREVRRRISASWGVSKISPFPYCLHYKRSPRNNKGTPLYNHFTFSIPNLGFTSHFFPLYSNCKTKANKKTKIKSKRKRGKKL